MSFVLTLRALVKIQEWKNLKVQFTGSCQHFVALLSPFSREVTERIGWLLQVIFVDADQIIRTDMGELYDMDIKGRPLAYTPFCENNKEMDGFRFWNQVRKGQTL